MKGDVKNERKVFYYKRNDKLKDRRKIEMVKNSGNAVNNMFTYRNKIIILGLTGRTGSGCSSVAKILRKQEMDELDLKVAKSYDYYDSEERKQEIIYNYIKADNWKKFFVIEGSCIILSFILENGFEKFKGYLEKNDVEGRCKIDNLKELIDEINKIEEIFNEGMLFSLQTEDEMKSAIGEKNDEYYMFYTEKIAIYKEMIYDILRKHICYLNKDGDSKAQLYTYLMQTCANNIRASGNPYNEKFTEENYYDIAKRMNCVIDIICKHENEEVRICIDALRNPYECIYFKDNYRNFYLVSISTDNNFRKSRLSYLSRKEQDSLDKIESPNKFEETEQQFYHQNIQACIELSDIHLYNPDVQNNKYYFLTGQIVKYIALILHPGLVTPTHIERCMQLAYNAKFNSGCLSRQVGAVITGDDFSVRAVGWNDVPKGQIPCILRNVNGYCTNKDCESFSEFELCDADFEEAIQKIKKELEGKELGGRMFSYCFKDVYNGYLGTDNQVYTRSLHAEENAFLQISKYGGMGIRGGFLFTTASPCELCAKKAYQLGITNIYYIDPYPGISMKHILSFGKSNNPTMNLFYGAIGNAYISLYEPRMAVKDELELVSGIKVKKLVEKDGKSNESNPIVSDIKYEKMNISLEYTSKEEIFSTRDIVLEVTGAPINHVEKKIIWTGSQYKKTMLVEPQQGFEIEDSTRKVSPYTYKILFNRNIMRGEKVAYIVKTEVSDSDNQMKPFLSHEVKNPTDRLTLIFKVVSGYVEGVFAQEYRDNGFEIKVGEKQILKMKKAGKYEIYEYIIENPKILHTYCIHWNFKEIIETK